MINTCEDRMPKGIYKQLNLLVSEEAVFGTNTFNSSCMSSLLPNLKQSLFKSSRLRCLCISSPVNGTRGEEYRKI